MAKRVAIGLHRQLHGKGIRFEGKAAGITGLGGILAVRDPDGRRVDGVVPVDDHAVHHEVTGPYGTVAAAVAEQHVSTAEGYATGGPQAGVGKAEVVQYPAALEFFPALFILTVEGVEGGPVGGGQETGIQVQDLPPHGSHDPCGQLRPGKQ